MSKSFKLIIALLVALFTLPVSGVFAAGSDSFTDGEHELNYLILKDTVNEVTGSARSFGETALLTVENGTKTVEISFTGSSMIEELSIQGVESNVTRNDDEDTGVLTFTLDGEVTDTLLMDLKINAGPYGIMEHTLRVFLNVDKIDDIPAEQLEASLIKEEVEEKEDTVADKLKSGEINYLILKGDANDVSSSARSFGETALLTVEEGKKIVSLNFTGSKMIAELDIQNNDTDKITRNEAEDTGVLSFVVDGELTEPLLLDMKINAGPYGTMEHTVRVFLDVANVADIPAEKLEASLVKEEVKEEETTKEEETKEPVKEEATKEPVVKDQFAPDKVYEINYVVKHATEDQDSAADQFFKKPAYLLEKNGEKYIQLTVTNSDMIDSLSTAHGEVVIVKENADGSMVVQFKVTDLSKPVVMDMHITVPGMYSMDHSARLIFDEASLTEVDAADHQLAESANSNGKTVNPQTGDNTNILLYVLLLIGSAVPLAIIAKRRFA